MLTATLENLLAHLQWADEQALTALRSAGERHAGALELLAHVIGAEETWLARLEGRVPALAVWPNLDLGELTSAMMRTHAALAAWLATADDEALDAEIDYVNSAGTAFRTRAADIVLHVMLHGAYHRGQIALLLRQSGTRPLPTDYIAFVRGAPAATRGGTA